MSVVNKAIQNNKSMDLKANTNDESDLHYVNIKIELGENNLYKTEVYKVENSKANATKDQIEIDDFPKAQFNPQPKIKEVASINGEITLGTKKADDTLVMNNEFVDFFTNNEVKDQVLVDDTKNITYYIYSALTTFKKSVFTCSDVKYNENGRITEMTFILVKEKQT